MGYMKKLTFAMLQQQKVIFLCLGTGIMALLEDTVCETVIWDL